jgi:hypothetical protein
MKPSNKEWLSGFPWGVAVTCTAFVVLALVRMWAEAELPYPKRWLLSVTPSCIAAHVPFP